MFNVYFKIRSRVQNCEGKLDCLKLSEILRLRTLLAENGSAMLSENRI